MGIAVNPTEGKPYVLMVADSMSTQLVYDRNKETGKYEVSGTETKEDVQKLHKFHKNLIIGFEGMLVGDVHHKMTSNLQNIVEPNDDLHGINKKVIDEIISIFPKNYSEQAQYSVIMSGFIDGTPSLNKIVFRNKKVIENIFQKPVKGTFKPIFDPHVTQEMVERFTGKVLQYKPNNVSLFREALVSLAKEASTYSLGSNDIIKVERLR